MNRPSTLGELKSSGYRPRSIRDEMRENLIRKLRDCGYDGLLCPEHLGPAAPGQDVEAEAVAYAKALRAS